MMQFEFYVLLFIVPALVVIISSAGESQFKSVLIIPLIVFTLSILAAITMASFMNVGVRGLIGWGVIYTLLSLLVISIARYRNKKVAQQRT